MLFRQVLIFAMLAYFPLQAQLTDDFSDGEITTNPAWSGNIADFIVNAGELQLSAAVAGTSFIYTPIMLGDSAEWQFYYRMEFAPSAANKLRVYLMLDTETLTSANGYFIEIGENGGEDAIKLLRLDNGIAFDVAASEGLFGSDPSLARVRVTRDIDAQWTVFVDVAGGENFTQLFTINETAHALSGAEVFGIECTYTDTRRDKFFFDDVFAGIPSPDTSAAQLIDIIVENDTQIRVQFNEALEDVSALDASNYSITPGIGTPSSVLFTDSEHRTVQLTLPGSLQSQLPYTLTVSGVRDLAGNISDTSLGFEYVEVVQPNPYDILINEIMADPSPPLGLPNAEYIELYNRSIEAFQLENYALTVGSQTEILPSWIVAADGYVVLVDQGDVDLFTGIPNVLAIDLPSLTNTGTTLELSDDLGTVLHRLSYDINSYQDGAKDDGGWSLELINSYAPCSLTNIRASLDLTGGTPGRENSVSMNNEPDTSGPQLLRATPVSSTSLEVVFDEVISGTGVLISLEPAQANISSFVDGNILVIIFQTPLEVGILYTLSVTALEDCLGNVGSTATYTFALPQSTEPGDLYINEILFDPGTGGSRFIEVINVSNKYLDLNELIIADIQGDTIAAFPVETSFLLNPGAIAAITPNPLDIQTRYFMHNPAQIIMSTLPSFNRTAGNATIYTRSGVVLDAFDYRADFHNALIDDDQGVSLERISPQLPTQSRETWYSAAGSAGFATPGLPNSQRLPDFTGEGIIEIQPEIFSPDEDGTDDFLVVSFPGVSPGMLASVRVFDAHGRPIVNLAENVSIGQEAIIRWDGIDENGSRARIGAYVLWIELYGPDGTVEHYKRTCVLAERL